MSHAIATEAQQGLEAPVATCPAAGTPTTTREAVLVARRREQRDHLLHAMFNGMEVRTKAKGGAGYTRERTEPTFDKQRYGLLPAGRDSEDREVYTVIDRGPRRAGTRRRPEPVVSFAVANQNEYNDEFNQATAGVRNPKFLPVAGQNLLRRPGYAECEEPPVKGLDLLLHGDVLAAARIRAPQLAHARARDAFMERWGDPLPGKSLITTWVAGWVRVEARPINGGTGTELYMIHEAIEREVAKSLVEDQVFDLLDGTPAQPGAQAQPEAAQPSQPAQPEQPSTAVPQPAGAPQPAADDATRGASLPEPAKSKEADDIERRRLMEERFERALREQKDPIDAR